MIVTVAEPTGRSPRMQVTTLAAPTWQPPPWVEKLQADPASRGLIECETARKLVAYVGYDDAMTGSEINQMREALAKDFPRARTVIYKYHVGDVVMWAGKRPPLALAVPPAQAEAIPTAALHLDESDFVPRQALVRGQESGVRSQGRQETVSVDVMELLACDVASQRVTKRRG